MKSYIKIKPASLIIFAVLLSIFTTIVYTSYTQVYANNMYAPAYS